VEATTRLRAAFGVKKTDLRRDRRKQ